MELSMKPTISVELSTTGHSILIVRASAMPGAQEIRTELTDEVKAAIRKCLDAAEVFDAPKQKAA